MTTVLAAAITDKKLFTVTVLLHKGQETYRYQVMTIDTTGVCGIVVYESSGSREYCFKAFTFQETKSR